MSLLENIVFKKQKINFDLSKSLNENLGSGAFNRNINIEQNAPVQVNTTDWSEKENYLTCNFSFSGMPRLAYFINEILLHADKINHTPDISITDLNVFVSLQTKDLFQITESDLDFANFISEIYDDVKFIRDF